MTGFIYSLVGVWRASAGASLTAPADAPPVDGHATAPASGPARPQTVPKQHPSVHTTHSRRRLSFRDEVLRLDVITLSFNVTDGLREVDSGNGNGASYLIIQNNITTQ